MRIAITGSNGFIGKELVGYFLSNGHQVLLLQRKKPDVLPMGAAFQPYDLNKTEALPSLESVDALVHTAYVPFTKWNDSAEINIQSTTTLYNLCNSIGIQFIFLSSMSAHSLALSHYGRHKFELEQKLDTSRCLILKLGLVIGNEGLFSRINNSLKKMPFAFLVGGGKQPVQPVYIGDVVKTIGKCIAEKRTGVYTLAINRVYTMKEFFTAIANRSGKKPFFISIPYSVVNFGISILELLHLPFPVSQENLLGLKQLRSSDTSADLIKLGVTLLDLNESISALAR